MSLDRMSTLDAFFLYTEEDGVNLMHVGGLAILDGPCPSYEELYRSVAGKLPHLPRYRQLPRTVPFAIGRPVWVDDEAFELGYHLRHAVLPSPGSSG